MNRSIRTALTAAVVLTMLSAVAEAQYRPSNIGPPRGFRNPLRGARRPTVSPYLDFLSGARAGRGVGYQYLRRIRPELELRKSNAQFARSLNNVNNELARQRQLQRRQQTPSAVHTPGTTGHPTSFMSPTGFSNTSSYFPIGGR